MLNYYIHHISIIIYILHLSIFFLFNYHLINLYFFFFFNCIKWLFTYLYLLLLFIFYLCFFSFIKCSFLIIKFKHNDFIRGNNLLNFFLDFSFLRIKLNTSFFLLEMDQDSIQNLFMMYILNVDLKFINSNFVAYNNQMVLLLFIFYHHFFLFFHDHYYE